MPVTSCAGFIGSTFILDLGNPQWVRNITQGSYHNWAETQYASELP